jgi:hypothetical protein
MFLDGKLSCWGNRSSNVLSFLVKSYILKLIGIGIDLIPLMTYRSVFACLPCLWKTPLEKDRLQVLVDAIGKKSASHPKSALLSVSAIIIQMQNSTLHGQGKHVQLGNRNKIGC